MTGEQKKWLDDNRVHGYRPLGATPGGGRWVNVGMLHADGTFELKLGRARPTVKPGSFEVGVLEHSGAPHMNGPGG